MVLWACSSKRCEFRHFTVTNRVSRVSSVTIGIRVIVRIRVSLVLAIGRGQDFPTWNECSHTSGSRRVATAVTQSIVKAGSRP